jgi:chorismate dehydratase
VPVNIGRIAFANCTPIFTALEQLRPHLDYHLVPGVPSALNRLLATGVIDLCPSSSVEYVKQAGQYVILPELSISSIGPVKSVLLFSRFPLTELDGVVIGLTGESDTSVILLNIILSRFLGFRNRYERTLGEPDSSFQQYPALLLIGDKAMKAAQGESLPYVYDLGELWHRYTGLPFVFAFWLVRRDAIRSKGSQIALLHCALVAAKEYAYRTYADIAKSCPESAWYGEQRLMDYWNTISYDLTPRHCEGASLFFRHGADLGLLPIPPELEFFSGEGEGSST